jgi:stage V sporulation protein B
MSRAQKSILSGVTILGVTGIVCKIIGVLFRIPLGRLIGNGGLGLYQLVFPTYSLLLTISSAGLPVAVSRMVSYCISQGDPKNARRVFRVALYMLMALGLAATIAMIAGSDLLTRQVGDPQTKQGFIAIAPSVFIVCVMSAFRGFLQGQQRMAPTAISQLIEQAGKVALALPLAVAGSRQGIGQAAAGALLGTSVIEGVALVYIIFVYLRGKKALEVLPQDPSRSLIPIKTLMKRLAANAVPITLGACIVPLAAFIDSGMLVNRLKMIGFSGDDARSMYELYSGLVITLINVPTALSAALGMSLVPAISGHFAQGNYEGIARQGSLGLRFSFLIGLPCSLGMSILARPILDFFYAGDKFSPAKLALASEYLAVSALTVVIFMVVQSTASILQGLRKQRIPMYTLMAGVVFKILLNYVLVGIPGIDIHGAPIASLVCYTVSMIPNVYYVLKHAHMRFDFSNFVARPALATAVMAAAVYAGREVLPAGRITTLLLVAIGIAVYIGAAFLFGAATKEDIRAMKRRGREAVEEEQII